MEGRAHQGAALVRGADGPRHGHALQVRHGRRLPLHGRVPAGRAAGDQGRAHCPRPAAAGLRAALGQGLLSVGIGITGASLPTFLVSAFPPHVRYTCIAIGYNLAVPCLSTLFSHVPVQQGVMQGIAGSIDRFGALLGFSPEPATPYVRAESFGAALFEETITSPLNVGTTPFKS